MVFDEIYGHERQKREILAFVSKDRIPHAFMFLGPEGIGKKLLGLKLASLLLCENRLGGDGCSSCLRVERRTHPDLVVVGERKDPIGIETVKSICFEAKRRPYDGKLKVFIIDNCHLMTPEATNSILKTLEEPSPSSLFILVTSREWEIMPTLRSRCVLIRFSALDHESLISYLMERHRLSREKAEILSHISLGRIGLCEFWMDEGNRALRKEIAAAILKGKGNFLSITRISEEIGKRGVEEYLQFLISLFRDMMVINLTEERKRLYNKDLVDLIQDVKVEPKKAHKILLELKRAQREIRYNINVWAYLEALIISLRNSI